MDPQQVQRDAEGVMRCTQCGFRYDHSPAEVADLAVTGYSDVQDAVNATPSERLSIRPAPAVWSVNAYAGHLAEASGVILHRVRLITTEDRPPIAWYDEGESVERNRMDDRPAGESLPTLHQNVTEFARFIRDLPPEAWERVGMHSRAGEIRLSEAAHDMAHELRHHAGDIHAIGVEGRVPS